MGQVSLFIIENAIRTIDIFHSHGPVVNKISIFWKVQFKPTYNEHLEVQAWQTCWSLYILNCWVSIKVAFMLQGVIYKTGSLIHCLYFFYIFQGYLPFWSQSHEWWNISGFIKRAVTDNIISTIIVIHGRFLSKYVKLV
jgi:hypothetical protein